MSAVPLTEVLSGITCLHVHSLVLCTLLGGSNAAVSVSGHC